MTLIQKRLFNIFLYALCLMLGNVLIALISIGPAELQTIFIDPMFKQNGFLLTLCTITAVIMSSTIIIFLLKDYQDIIACTCMGILANFLTLGAAIVLAAIYSSIKVPHPFTNFMQFMAFSPITFLMIFESYVAMLNFFGGGLCGGLLFWLVHKNFITSCHS